MGPRKKLSSASNDDGNSSNSKAQIISERLQLKLLNDNKRVDSGTDDEEEKLSDIQKQVNVGSNDSLKNRKQTVGKKEGMNQSQNETQNDNEDEEIEEFEVDINERREKRILLETERKPDERGRKWKGTSISKDEYDDDEGEDQEVEIRKQEKRDRKRKEIMLDNVEDDDEDQIEVERQKPERRGRKRKEVAFEETEDDEEEDNELPERRGRKRKVSVTNTTEEHDEGERDLSQRKQETRGRKRKEVVVDRSEEDDDDEHDEVVDEVTIPRRSRGRPPKNKPVVKEQMAGKRANRKSLDEKKDSDKRNRHELKSDLEDESGLEVVVNVKVQSTEVRGRKKKKLTNEADDDDGEEDDESNGRRKEGKAMVSSTDMTGRVKPMEDPVVKMDPSGSNEGSNTISNTNSNSSSSSSGMGKRYIKKIEEWDEPTSSMVDHSSTAVVSSVSSDKKITNTTTSTSDAFGARNNKNWKPYPISFKTQSRGNESKWDGSKPNKDGSDPVHPTSTSCVAAAAKTPYAKSILNMTSHSHSSSSHAITPEMKTQTLQSFEKIIEDYQDILAKSVFKTHLNGIVAVRDLETKKVDLNQDGSTHRNGNHRGAEFKDILAEFDRKQVNAIHADSGDQPRYDQPTTGTLATIARESTGSGVGLKENPVGLTQDIAISMEDLMSIYLSMPLSLNHIKEYVERITWTTEDPPSEEEADMTASLMKLTYPLPKTLVDKYIGYVLMNGVPAEALVRKGVSYWGLRAVPELIQQMMLIHEENYRVMVKWDKKWKEDKVVVVKEKMKERRAKALQLREEKKEKLKQQTMEWEMKRKEKGLEKKMGSNKIMIRLKSTEMTSNGEGKGGTEVGVVERKSSSGGGVVVDQKGERGVGGMMQRKEDRDHRKTSTTDHTSTATTTTDTPTNVRNHSDRNATPGSSTANSAARTATISSTSKNTKQPTATVNRSTPSKPSTTATPTTDSPRYKKDDSERIDSTSKKSHHHHHHHSTTSIKKESRHSNEPTPRDKNTFKNPDPLHEGELGRSSSQLNSHSQQQQRLHSKDPLSRPLPTPPSSSSSHHHRPPSSSHHTSRSPTTSRSRSPIRGDPYRHRLEKRDIRRDEQVYRYPDDDYEPTVARPSHPPTDWEYEGRRDASSRDHAGDMYERSRSSNDSMYERSRYSARESTDMYDRSRSTVRESDAGYDRPRGKEPIDMYDRSRYDRHHHSLDTKYDRYKYDDYPSNGRY